MRALIFDQDAVARRLLREHLKNVGCSHVAEAPDLDEAVRLVRVEKPDVVVFRSDASGMGPSATARRFREAARDVSLMIRVAADEPLDEVGTLERTALISNPAEVEPATAALAAGRSYVSSEIADLVMAELRRKAQQTHAQNEELLTTVRQLEAASITDWLTSLKNHGYFFDRLAEELERARRYGRPLAVLMADLDDFKSVNDAFGHTAGNTVLRAMGEVLRTSVREVDVACRVGGEEFGVIMPETDADGAVQAAERIRRAVSQQRTPGVGTVTVSVGVAVFPYHARTRDQLVEVADRALYLAKRDGKNRTRLAGERIGPVTSTRRRSYSGPVVSTLVSALRMRSDEMADHSTRVAEIATAIGTHLELGVEELEHLRLAALLHDIGMLGVPDGILSKEGPLSKADWDVIRRHPQNGFDLISGSVHPSVADAVLTHHERMDGTGYPQKLSGDAIPLLGRIVLVADAYDAMMSHRPFADPRSSLEALGELEAAAGKQFDQATVAALRVLISDPEANSLPDADVLQFPTGASS